MHICFYAFDRRGLYNSAKNTVTFLLKSLKFENTERTHSHCAYFFICFHIKTILTSLELNVLCGKLSKSNEKNAAEQQRKATTTRRVSL